MKILGVSGSPNRNGNNEQIIRYALDIAEKNKFETNKIFLSEYKIEPCTDCNSCKTKKECKIDDGMRILIPFLTEADAIIVSSPVYFGSISAQLKAFFDRTLPLRRHGLVLRNKVGAAIAIGASRNGGQELAIQTIHAWMHINGMLVVGDNNHFGGILKKPIKKDKEGRKTVKDTAEKVCTVLKLIGGEHSI